MPNDATSRREFLRTGSAAALAQGSIAAPNASKKPNFVFFMPETLRAESLGCYGHPLVRTPNIDRMAAEGVRFNQCHVQNPVCGPSRCSLMTGWPVHVRGHRSLYYFLHPDEPNLFRYLKQNGYEVYWYGKNDLLSPETFADSVTDWGPRRGKEKPEINPWPKDDRHHYSFLYKEGGDRRDTADYANLQAGIQAIERSSKPFCVYLPLSYAHPPFTAPRDFYGMYDPAKLPALRPPDLKSKPNFHDAIRRTRRLNELNDADFRQIQAVYLGMISYSDWLLGELMAALDRTGHAQDTNVFLFSDHGEWGGDYGLVEKWPSALDDTMTRVPLIVRGPGVKAGGVCQEIVEQFDVMPTTLQLAGIAANHTHFARSLVPQLQGAGGDPHRAAFSEGGYNTYEPQCFEPMESGGDIYMPKIQLQNQRPETITRATMIRTREEKLIYRPDGESEFYDLLKDPRELNNVYSDRSYSTRREAARARMLDWYVRTADVAPKQHDPRGFPPRP